MSIGKDIIDLCERMPVYEGTVDERLTPFHLLKKGSTEHQTRSLEREIGSLEDHVHELRQYIDAKDRIMDGLKDEFKRLAKKFYLDGKSPEDVKKNHIKGGKVDGYDSYEAKALIQIIDEIDKHPEEIKKMEKEAQKLGSQWKELGKELDTMYKKWGGPEAWGPY